MFSSFVFPRPTRRDDPADVVAERADDRDFAPFDDPEYLVPDFAMAI
jgi:hypothetical protein